MDLAGDLLGQHPGRRHRPGADHALPAGDRLSLGPDRLPAALVLIVGGVSLSVIGFQQSANWGWGNPWTVVCIVVGVALLVAFALVELRTASPLMQVRIFQIRAFAVENLVLGISMLVFVPLFFFASEYAQIAARQVGPAGRALPPLFLPRLCGDVADRWPHPGSQRSQTPGGDRMCACRCRIWPLGQPADPAGLLQPGVAGDPGRRRDGVHVDAGQHRRRQPGLASVLWGGDRDYPDHQELCSQPGLRRARHHTGHPVAIPGQLIVGRSGRPQPGACPRRGVQGSGSPREPGANTASIPHFYRVDFAYASRTVFYIMAGIMAVAAVVALLGLERGLQAESREGREEVRDAL